MVNVGQHEALARFVDLLAPGDKRVPSANEPADLASASSGLQRSTIGWAVAVSHQCADAVVATMGEHVSVLPEAETRRAIETSVLSLLRHIAGHAGQSGLNAEQLSAAHTMARLGLPYERFMGGLRLVQTMVLDALLDRAAQHRPVQNRRPLLSALPAMVTGFFDDSVGAVVSEYLAERQRAISQTLADRRRITTALIAGEYVAEEVAAHTLGIDLAQYHLALILWAQGQDAAAHVQGELEHAAARAADSLHASALLTIPDDSDDRALLCWITSPAPFPADHLGALSGLFPAADSFRAAVGVPVQGAAGFRRTHLAARDAQQVARRGLPGKVTAYRDVGVIALLAADPERAHWFVTGELGQLASPGNDALADLRATALRYLECRSLVRTAADLHVHRNTLVYRLANIERILGHPLDERPLATHAALALAEQLGTSLRERDLTTQPPARDLMDDLTYLLCATTAGGPGPVTPPGSGLGAAAWFKGADEQQRQAGIRTPPADGVGEQRPKRRALHHRPPPGDVALVRPVEARHSAVPARRQRASAVTRDLPPHSHIIRIVRDIDQTLGIGPEDDHPGPIRYWPTSTTMSRGPRPQPGPHARHRPRPPPSAGSQKARRPGQ
jgi:sugar diacid utilization regulator